MYCQLLTSAISDLTACQPLCMQFPITVINHEAPLALLPMTSPRTRSRSSHKEEGEEGLKAHIVIFGGLVFSTAWLGLIERVAQQAARIRRNTEASHQAGGAQAEERSLHSILHDNPQAPDVSRSSRRCREEESSGKADISSTSDGSGGGTRVAIRVTAVSFEAMQFDASTGVAAAEAARFLQTSAAVLGLHLSCTAVQVGVGPTWREKGGRGRGVMIGAIVGLGGWGMLPLSRCRYSEVLLAPCV